MRTTLFITSIIALFIAGVIGYVLPKAQGQEAFNLGGSRAALAPYRPYGTATTSVVYMSPTGETGTTATSTIQITTEGVSSLDLNVQYNASTTASNLVWIQEFSYNGIDWYNEDVASVAGSVVTHNATASAAPYITMHSWTPGVAGIAMKNITITPIASKYMRISFSSWGANGSLWIESISKKPY